MRRKRKRYLLILAASVFLVLVMLAITIAHLVRPLSPSRAFRKFVCDPIPKSVREIKVDLASGFLGDYMYVLHFRIDEPDLLPILNSRPFREIQYIKYDSTTGSLSYAEEDPYSLRPAIRRAVGRGFGLYDVCRGEREPEWFNLEQWDSPKVYMWEKERIDLYHVRLLVFNKELGEAHFIAVRAGL